MSQIIKHWKDQFGGKQQSISFTFEDHISKITITKNASNDMLKTLKNCNINPECLIVKE